MTKGTKVNIEVHCVVSHNAAIAGVSMYTEDFEIIKSSGTAVRHPDDKFDRAVAENLAIGRALESLGKKLQKRGHGVVKQNEDNAARKEKQKADATKKSTERGLSKFRRWG